MKAIELLERDGSSMTVGHAALGVRNGRRETVRQAVHDGDTATIAADGNFSVRLLGVDTPEVSFRLPNAPGFPPLSGPQWEEFLTDPLAERFGRFDREVPPALARHIKSRTGSGTAALHLKHARAAEDAFESLIAADIEALGQTTESFRFFLAFGFEVTDGYGRMLCYLNREQPDPDRPAPRPLSYNERMLELGRAFPYFIWPNVNPYRRAAHVTAAVIPPNTQKTLAERDRSLRQAREFTQAARAAHRGVFDAMEPAMLEPFELRWLASRSLPHRWVIDLTRNDDVLVRPENYSTIPHPEDRLWIPEHFVPLFVEHGWRREER
jgi:hypothetical protein